MVQLRRLKLDGSNSHQIDFMFQIQKYFYEPLVVIFISSNVYIWMRIMVQEELINIEVSEL